MTDADSSREFVDKVKRERVQDATYKGFPGFFVSNFLWSLGFFRGVPRFSASNCPGSRCIRVVQHEMHNEVRRQAPPPSFPRPTLSFISALFFALALPSVVGVDHKGDTIE